MDGPFKAGSPVHPSYLKAGHRNIAETTRGVNDGRKEKKLHPLILVPLVLLAWTSLLGIVVLVAVAFGW